jgi:hypothetical protein
MESVNDRVGKAGGTLMLAAAPIGSPADASPRLAAALGEAPVIAAEDTRPLRGLASALGVRLSGRVDLYQHGHHAIDSNHSGRQRHQARPPLLVGTQERSASSGPLLLVPFTRVWPDIAELIMQRRGPHEPVSQRNDQAVQHRVFPGQQPGRPAGLVPREQPGTGLDRRSGRPATER